MLNIKKIKSEINDAHSQVTAWEEIIKSNINLIEKRLFKINEIICKTLDVVPSTTISSLELDIEYLLNRKSALVDLGFTIENTSLKKINQEEIYYKIIEHFPKKWLEYSDSEIKKELNKLILKYQKEINEVKKLKKENVTYTDIVNLLNKAKKSKLSHKEVNFLKDSLVTYE